MTTKSLTLNLDLAGMHPADQKAVTDDIRSFLQAFVDKTPCVELADTTEIMSQMRTIARMNTWEEHVTGQLAGDGEVPEDTTEEEAVRFVNKQLETYRASLDYVTGQDETLEGIIHSTRSLLGWEDDRDGNIRRALAENDVTFDTDLPDPS